MKAMGGLPANKPWMIGWFSSLAFPGVFQFLDTFPESLGLKEKNQGSVTNLEVLGGCLWSLLCNEYWSVIFEQVCEMSCRLFG